MNVWPDEHVEMMRRLRRSKASFSDIADALNTKFGTAYTRNSIAGRAKRMGLCTAREVKPVQEKSEAIEVKKGDRLSVAVGAAVQMINRLKSGDVPRVSQDGFVPRVVEVLSLRKTILELRAMECRWADEDRNADGLHTFCGNRTASGSSYCPAHAELNRGVGTPAERAVLDMLKGIAA